MAEQAIPRSKVRERKRRQAQRKRMTAGAIILGGILLTGAAGWWVWSGRPSAQATIDYGPEDIAYDQPLHAEHEMGSGPPIPFLPKDGPQPRVAVNERFYDFGSLGPAEVATREFVIANQGDAPLTISRAYTTCGCTTADITSGVIPPGKVAIVTLVFDAGFHDVRGETVRRGLIIENNDPDRSTVEIWTQASIRSSP
ncbi:MAG TPA: DUF1573 domain-containing protein [Anaerolineales bacterium]|nr:DUF1573 domain-containing protein [Anaerolineales bacterium]